MTANLNVTDYDGRKYYMWDAKNNYWNGHEWNSAAPLQPVLKGKDNSNYPKSDSDSYYRALKDWDVMTQSILVRICLMLMS